MDESKEFDEIIIRRVEGGLQIEYRQQGDIVSIATCPLPLDLDARLTIANVRGRIAPLAHHLP